MWFVFSDAVSSLGVYKNTELLSVGEPLLSLPDIVKFPQGLHYHVSITAAAVLQKGDNISVVGVPGGYTPGLATGCLTVIKIS